MTLWKILTVKDTSVRLLITIEILTYTLPGTKRTFIYLFIFLLTDLAEVVSVTPAAPTPGPPKKTDDKSFFDVSLKFFLFLIIFLIFKV